MTNWACALTVTGEISKTVTGLGLGGTAGTGNVLLSRRVGCPRFVGCQAQAWSGSEIMHLVNEEGVQAALSEYRLQSTDFQRITKLPAASFVRADDEYGGIKCVWVKDSCVGVFTRCGYCGQHVCRSEEHTSELQSQ